MNPTVWRYSLSLLTLFALFIAFADALDRNRFGSPGFAVQLVNEHEAIVSELDPESGAARAGVRNGDRIRAGWIRIAAVLGPGADVSVRAGELMTFEDLRTGRTVTITASPLPEVFSADRVVSHVLRIISLILALVLFWRWQPADRAARALGAFLLTYNMQGWGDTGSFIFRSIWISQMIADIATVGTLLMLVLFACWFPSRYPHDVRRTIAAAACAFAGLALALRLDAIQYAFFGSAALPAHGYYVGLTDYVEPAVFGALLIGALVVDFRTSSQLDRLRLEWLTLGMTLQIYASILSNLVFAQFLTGIAGASTALGDAINIVAQIGGTVCMLYAFVHYRVLDITFAINRATVFATLSTFVVGLFVLVEYLISKYVESHSHITGLAITLAAALAVGISLRTIHRYVDRVVDQVVFRQRHRDEEAIRTFGRRARFITDEIALEQRAVETLDTHARSEGSALFLRTEGGDYFCAVSSLSSSTQLVDRNAAPIVMMKDSGGSCYVQNAAAVPGELVLPMIVRGELFGFAACGRRRIRELYAPDELEAMAYMVDRLGIQLDALRTARMQNILGDITNLVRAHLLLGGDGATLIAHIAEMTGAAHGALAPPATVNPGTP